MRRLLEDFGGVFVQGEHGKKKRNKKDAIGVEVKKKDGAGNGITQNNGAATAAGMSSPRSTAEANGRGKCRFEKGKCPYGSKCRFLHVRAEEPAPTWASVADPNSKKQPDAAAAWGAGVSPRFNPDVDDDDSQDGEKKHGGNGQKKPRPCPLWGRKGRCRFGDRCKYVHDPEARGAKQKKKTQQDHPPGITVPASAAGSVVPGLGDGMPHGSGMMLAPRKTSGSILSFSPTESDELIALSRGSASPVNVHCPRCTTLLPPNARFCLSCGFALTTSPSAGFSTSPGAGGGFSTSPSAALSSSPDDRNALRLSIGAAPFVPAPNAVMPASMVRTPKSNDSSGGNSRNHSARTSERSSGSTGGGGGGVGSGGSAPSIADPLFSAFGSESLFLGDTSSKYDSMGAGSRELLDRSNEDYDDLGALGSLLDDVK